MKSVMISDEMHKELRIYTAQKESSIINIAEFAIMSMIKNDNFVEEKSADLVDK